MVEQGIAQERHRLKMDVHYALRHAVEEGVKWNHQPDEVALARHDIILTYIEPNHRSDHRMSLRLRSEQGEPVKERERESH